MAPDKNHSMFSSEFNTNYFFLIKMKNFITLDRGVFLFVKKNWYSHKVFYSCDTVKKVKKERRTDKCSDSVFPTISVDRNACSFVEIKTQ